MPTDVIMPQMGESIFEGTITKWLKKPGDKIQRDEPLFEISTDKVDAEIPAPASGVLKEIKVSEGATVQVNTIVGVIDAEGAAASSSAPAPQPARTAAETTGGAASTDGAAQVKPAPQADAISPPRQAPATETAPAVQSGGNGGAGTDVVMPQMGESIFEGTITKWLKKPGDKVQRDEPLFEISTDKVDAEIPAPTSGVLREIKVPEGTTVQVNTVVAVIGDGAGAPAKAATPAPAARPAEKAPKKVEQPVAVQAQPVERPHEVISFPEREQQGDGERIRSSPLVRRIARENRVDLASVPGTGLGGRITKDDILSFVQQHGPATAAKPARPAAPQPMARPAAPQPISQPQAAAQPRPVQAAQPQILPELAGELVPMTPMRKKIAERMVESKRTSAHVHTVFKVDMTRVVRLREKVRRQWEERHGVKLTFMPFIAKALMHGIRKKPIVNASVVGDSIQYHKNINIGIAVALEWGLIVPVVKGAENLSFVGLQRAVTDLGERARAKKLVPDEVQGGTITITNPGIFGPQFGTPIILQPQVAILGMGGIFKEPVVITDEHGNDSIAIRHIIRLTLGYDHRIIDGAEADQFMVAVRDYLEKFDEDIG
ncbi:MAG TPA: 2-oxoglutarate dehydrogenase, E2 component, dihydrolipoamide succinyltransferase [Candidatus Angelobacter sp.]|nr:2-oxoglutarate dehydrogenase, E2 component, dihydrolipoamide succinyltransferase [Candidatus Angelobacter sp.]